MSQESLFYNCNLKLRQNNSNIYAHKFHWSKKIAGHLGFSKISLNFFVFWDKSIRYFHACQRLDIGNFTAFKNIVPVFFK